MISQLWTIGILPMILMPFLAGCAALAAQAQFEHTGQFRRRRR